ncbi:MAG TPA: hypothetical protein VFX76_03735 [Roseiflexaceae bacterium]|nr:hypothetical protein [Roseiflexaceae bacterium]
MKRINTKRISIELSHDQWVALLAAAYYGANTLESEEDLPGVAGTADRLVERLQSRIGVENLIAAAEHLEDNDDDIPEPLGWSKPHITPSA